MAFNAAIGTLSVKISADTSDVRRAIKNTNKQLSKSGKYQKAVKRLREMNKIGKSGVQPLN